MRGLALIGIAFFGCATQSIDDKPVETGTSIPVIGEPGDFKTRPGQSDGYEVILCRDRSCGGIVGTGRNWPPGMERSPGYSDPAYEKSFQSFRAVLTAALKPDVPSLDTSGLSGRCGSDGIETVFWLHNWKELDAALASGGRFLKAKDLKENISFCVMPYSPGVNE